MKQFIFLLLLLLIGCSDSKNQKIKTIKEFPKEISLDYTLIHTPNILFYLGNMLMTDSLLITIDLKADTIFRTFITPGIVYKNGYVLRGAGPSEEVLADPFFQVENYNEIIYKSLTNIKSLIFQKDLSKAQLNYTIKLPGELFELSHILKLNDTLIIGWMWNQSSKKEFISYSTETFITKEFGPKYSEIGDKIPNKIKTSIFSKISTLKPDKTMFASAYDKIQLLRIFDSDGSLHKEIRFKDKTKIPEELITEKVSQNNMEHLKTFYQRVQSTDKYIYALYSGRSLGSITNKNNQTPDFCDEIHILDWEGNPILKVKLNKLFSLFAVSPKDDFIICYSLMNSNTLYKFDISSYLLY